MNLLNKLLEDLPFLMRDEEETFEEVNIDKICVTHVSDKAAFIDDNWIPKSQMRVGIDEQSLYVADWLYRKHF